MLTNRERNFLRGMGNELSPIVTIGKNGINEHVIEQLDQALFAHELVKCRVLPHTEYEPSEVAQELAEKTNAEIVQVVGRNMLVYRRPLPNKQSKLGWPTEV